MDNDNEVLERLVGIERDAQSVYDEAKAEKERRRQEFEARIARFDEQSDADMKKSLDKIRKRFVKERSARTDKMEADMKRALRMLDLEFASQMKENADEIVMEILK